MQFPSALDFSRVNRNVRCWRSSLQRVDINTQIQKTCPLDKPNACAAKPGIMCVRQRRQLSHAPSQWCVVPRFHQQICLPSNSSPCLNSATCVQRERQHVAKNSTHTSISIWGGFSAGVIWIMWFVRIVFSRINRSIVRYIANTLEVMEPLHGQQGQEPTMVERPYWESPNVLL